MITERVFTPVDGVGLRRTDWTKLAFLADSNPESPVREFSNHHRNCAHTGCTLGIEIPNTLVDFILTLITVFTDGLCLRSYTAVSQLPTSDGCFLQRYQRPEAWRT